MKIKITVEFSCDNQSFVHDSWYELNRISEQVSHVICDQLGSQVIHDLNGNKIGTITVKRNKK